MKGTRNEREGALKWAVLSCLSVRGNEPKRREWGDNYRNVVLEWRKGHGTRAKSEHQESVSGVPVNNSNSILIS